MSQTLGFAVSGGPNASEVVRLARLAEDLGYTSAWVAEGHGHVTSATRRWLAQIAVAQTSYRYSFNVMYVTMSVRGPYICGGR